MLSFHMFFCPPYKLIVGYRALIGLKVDFYFLMIRLLDRWFCVYPSVFLVMLAAVDDLRLVTL